MRSTILTCLFLLILHISNPVYCFGEDKANIYVPQNLYELYKEILDRGDTVKLRVHTSGYCPYESLTQIIKKNDSILIVNNITTPCLNANRNNTSPTTHKNKRKRSIMPPIEDFDYMPYSIEVPYSVQNLVYFNLQNAIGRLRIINLRRNLTTNSIFRFTPYSIYDLNYIEFMEAVICSDFGNEVTDKQQEIGNIKNIVLSEYGGGQAGIDTDLFGVAYRNTFGSNPTFLINHLWGIHITENLIVLIENVQNGLIVNGKEEEDFTAVFIKMAESIKPIAPDVFDLNELENYKQR